MVYCIMKKRLGVLAAMKKIILIPILMFSLLTVISCSSNNVGQDDLSISEIEDIEKTGEFNAEDFFSDEDVLEESGVAVDLEGVDSDLDISDDAELLSDVEFDEFEGENFDESSDFETDFADGSDAEFDEFDEFMTDESVAQNENFDLEEGDTAVADTGDLDIDEDDVFAEFDNMDVADTSTESTESNDLSFEDAFADDLETQQNIVDSNNVVSENDLFGEQEQAVAQDNVVTTETNPADDGGPTASQLLGSKNETGIGQTFGVGDTVSAVAKNLVPVQKMAASPFNRAGILLNTLYIVREGDTLQSIKDKIYGSNSSANLQQLNPTIKPNNLKVGEKIYYNSPNRPNDNSRMMFYYDDVGAQAQYHEIRSGQSIRKVAQDLLGHPRSWMEVWATNPDVESKWAVSKNHNLRYFPEGTAVAPTLAQNNQPELIEPAEEEPLSVTTNMNNEGAGTVEPDFDAGFDDFAEDNNQVAANDGAVTEVQPDFDQGFNDDFDQGLEDQAANDTSFDDGLDTGLNGQDAAAQAIPDNFKNAGTKNLGPFGLDQSMIDKISLGAGGALILAGLFFIARRRRGKRESVGVDDFDFAGNTQIDEQTKTRIDL